MSGHTPPGEPDALALVLAATEAAATAAAAQQRADLAAARPAAPGPEARAIAWIDACVERMLGQILHDPRFLALEGAWRSLHRLCQRAAAAAAAAAAHPGAPVAVRILPATRRELVRDLQRAPDLERAALFRRLFDDAYAAAEPFAALLADYEWGPEPEDADALDLIAATAAIAQCPVLTAPAPSLFGLAAWGEGGLPDAGALARSADSPRLARWRSVRDAEDARFVVLAMPRVLARAPDPGGAAHAGGARTEDAGDAAPLPARPACWAGAAWPLAARLIAGFARDGWAVAITGFEDGREDGLPVLPDGPAGPLEIALDERQDATLARTGLAPLVQPFPREPAAVAFLDLATAQRPKQYHQAEATQNAARAARLPWVMATARVTQALMLRARAALRRHGRDLAAAQRDLAAWLEAGMVERAAPPGQGGRPLREGRVELRRDPQDPGRFLLVARLVLDMPEGLAGVAQTVVAWVPRPGG